jgi:hypothetical protein
MYYVVWYMFRGDAGCGSLLLIALPGTQGTQWPATDTPTSTSTAGATAKARPKSRQSTAAAAAAAHAHRSRHTTSRAGTASSAASLSVPLLAKALTTLLSHLDNDFAGTGKVSYTLLLRELWCLLAVNIAH